MPQNDPTAIPEVPPVMISIARCESGQRQYNSSGSVLVSRTHDHGVYQINVSWKKKAAALGYDIDTEAGNIGFALWLYHNEGTDPWNSSKHCWGIDTS